MASNFTHTLIKIKYISEGYLPNFPYSLISDKEMFDAFTHPQDGYFDTIYPCVNPDLEEQYNELRSFIFDVISLYVDYSSEVSPSVRAQFEEGFDIPDWIYSYMLGTTISVYTPEPYIQDLYNLLNIDSQEVVFDSELSKQCYDISKVWVLKLPAKLVHRPPTVFGEPHVFKSLRLQSVDVLN